MRKRYIITTAILILCLTGCSVVNKPNAKENQGKEFIELHVDDNVVSVNIHHIVAFTQYGTKTRILTNTDTRLIVSSTVIEATESYEQVAEMIANANE